MKASILWVRFWAAAMLPLSLLSCSLGGSSGVRSVTVGLDTTCPYGLIA